MRINALVSAVLLILCFTSSVFAAADSGEPTAQEPVSEQTSEEAQVKEAVAEAAPAALPESTEAPAAVVVAEEDPEKKDAKPWSAGVSLGHNIGSGTFVSGPSSDYYDDVTQSWGINGSYRFDVLGHKISARAGWGLGVALTTPNNPVGQRVFLRDLSLKVADGSLYKDELTGINLSGSLSLSLPTSPESIHAEKWSVLGTSFGVSRKFGALKLSYSFGFTKYFYGSDVRVAMSSQVRDAEMAVAQADAALCSLGKDANDEDVYRCHRGGPNADFSIRNGFSASYDFTEHLGLSYSVGLSNRRNLNNYPESDELQADNAQNDRGGSDTFSTSIDLSYDITGQLGDAVDLPFSLSASMGISTAHGVWRADQKSIRWPLFYNSLGTDYGYPSAIPDNEDKGGDVNNIASNLGGFGFSLSGTF